MNDDNGEPAGVLSQASTWPLGDEEIELVAGIMRDSALLQGRLIGILDSFVKRNRLAGRWELAPNGREIQKARE